MTRAMAWARAGAALGEVPVGAIVFDGVGQVVAADHNRREIDRDPLAHAEILVLRQAAEKLDRWRLFDCTLVVTLEPCPMCAGAAVNARVARVVYGASDRRVGAAGTVFDGLQDPRLNHRPQVQGGICGVDCAQLLTSFFRERRGRNRVPDVRSSGL